MTPQKTEDPQRCSYAFNVEVVHGSGCLGVEWRPMQELDFLTTLRSYEICQMIERHNGLLLKKDLLEIGSANGTQLSSLRKICNSAVGIDIAVPPNPVVPVISYDGRHIPFASASFDLVFSSNVMEHIQDEPTLHREMHRVLRPGGKCLHVTPTATWRLWTSLAHYPNTPMKLIRLASKAANNNGRGDPRSSWPARLTRIFIQPRHGERGSWFTEHFLFRESSWRRRFESYGWCVESVESLGCFYTGYGICGKSLNWSRRRSLAKVFGSSSFLFILKSVAPA